MKGPEDRAAPSAGGPGQELAQPPRVVLALVELRRVALWCEEARRQPAASLELALPPPRLVLLPAQAHVPVERALAVVGPPARSQPLPSHNHSRSALPKARSPKPKPQSAVFPNSSKPVPSGVGNALRVGSCSCGIYSSCARGKRTRKVVPLPGVDCTSSSPSCI